jgi:hypothetical protein
MTGYSDARIIPRPEKPSFAGATGGGPTASATASRATDRIEKRGDR